MPTNLAIDDRLIDEAKKLGRHRTKKETVNAALDEYYSAPQTETDRRRCLEPLITIRHTTTNGLAGQNAT